MTESNKENTIASRS